MNPEKAKTAKLAQRVPQRRARGQNTRLRQNSEKDRFQRLLQKSVRETERQGFENSLSTGMPIVLQKAANKSNSPKWTRSENPTMPVQARSHVGLLIGSQRGAAQMAMAPTASCRQPLAQRDPACSL